MKKIIMAFGIIFMIGLVSALAIGAIITQEQLDGLDIDSLDLGSGFVKIDGAPKYSCDMIGRCYFYVSIKGLKVVEDGYEYTSEEDTIRISRQKYINIKRETNKTYMLSELRTNLINKYNTIVSRQAIIIKKYQTPEEDFDNLVSGLDLP